MPKKSPTELTPAQRIAALAKIHIGKKQLGMDEETYRAMLQQVAGVSSIRDLDSQGIDVVLAHFRQAGVIFTAPKRAGKKPHNLHSNADKAAQLQKIGALLADMQLSWEYAAGIAMRMYKKQALEFCSGAELIGITTALVNKQKKVAK